MARALSFAIDKRTQLAVSAEIANAIVRARAQFLQGNSQPLLNVVQSIDVADVPPALASPFLELLVLGRQWQTAVKLLDTINRLPPRLVHQVNYIRNRAALAQRRPDIGNMLDSRPKVNDWTLDADGRLGRMMRGAFVPTQSGTQDKISSDIDCALKSIQSFRPILFLGVGDGFALAHFSATDLELPHGMQQTIMIVETDLDLLEFVFQTHDFSQPDGIILAPRGRWYVGLNWQQDMRDEMIADPRVTWPERAILNSSDRLLSRQLIELRDEYSAQLEDTVEVYARWAAQRSTLEWRDALRGQGERKPRALLLTSRFTAVLKYSTQRCAAALEMLGWETCLVQEEADDERVSALRIAKLNASYLPDLVMVLNHLRFEQGALIPECVPYLAWIQDPMPQLLNTAAGESQKARDFVMSGLTSLVRNFSYPRRNMLTCHCLTPSRKPIVFDESKMQRDIVYLSHASHTAEELKASGMRAAAASELDSRRAEDVIDKIFQWYAEGKCFDSTQALGEWLYPQIGINILDREEAEKWASLIASVYPYLHRQQGLRWACKHARERGWKLEIFGRGWDRHDEFRDFARGPVENGAASDEIVATSRINLVLEPWALTSHWRGLDAMMLGASIVVRDHPDNRAHQRLWDVLAARNLLHVRDEAELTSLVDIEQDLEVGRYLRAFIHQGFPGDPIGRLRELDCTVGGDGTVPESLPDIAFDSSEQLKQRLDELISDVSRRRSIADALGTYVRRHFTYEEGMSRAIELMAQRIAQDEVPISLTDNFAQPAPQVIGLAVGE